MGLDATKHIGRILIHPDDPDIVYVAAVGDLWGPNPERGVFRTTDGAETWELILYVDDDTGAIDLAMDPSDPHTIFAAMYQRRRTGFGFNGGGPGSGLYRTLDGGDEWVELTDGLPAGPKGRIGVDVYRGDGNVVYALVEAAGDVEGVEEERSTDETSAGSGLFRSRDRGATWERMSDTNPRPMYYSQVRIDPTDPDRIYVLGSDLLVSDDGGRTFRSDGAEQIHVDHHDLWIDPADPDHLIIGSDGGVAASWDGTEHWRMYDNIALGQFYTISHDMRTPYYVCGGLQDNDPWCGPSNTRSFHGIRHQDWYETAYGDGFWTVVDPTDSTIVFSESQNGNMNRYDLVTGEKTEMQPLAGPRAATDSVEAYRFNWNAPLLISRHDPATIYLGANYLLRSPDRGMSWEEVGDADLTKQIDRDTLQIMGVAGEDVTLSAHDGIATYGNLTTVGESHFTPGVIWAGTDDGNVQLTRDYGATWTNVVEHVPGLPPRTYVSRLAASAHEPGRVYATFDGHRNGDYAPYVYVSDDYGGSWRAIVDGLPDGWSVNVLAEHPDDPDLLFVGNEMGVYVSVDRGDRWVRLKGNLPVVPVDDLVIHPRDNDLIVGTHGRSAWILEDLAPLEELDAETLAAAAHLFPVRDRIMWAQQGDWPFAGATYSAPNPPRASRIRYYLGDGLGDGDQDVTLTVRDEEGGLVRTLHGPARPGIHEILWDGRYDPPFEIDGHDDGDDEEEPEGPVVLPGVYSVTLDAAGTKRTRTARLVADPRRPMSTTDRQIRQDALLSLYRLEGPMHRAGERIDRLKEEMAGIADQLDGEGDGLIQRVETVQEELAALADRLEEVDEWLEVRSDIQQSSTLPTEDQLWEVEQAWSVGPQALRRLNALIEDSIPDLYRALNDAGIRPDPGPSIPLPRREG